MRTIQLFIPFPSLGFDEIFLKQMMPFIFKIICKNNDGSKNKIRLDCHDVISTVESVFLPHSRWLNGQIYVCFLKRP